MAAPPTQPMSHYVLGMEFVKQYYTFLAEAPDKVHKFYKEHSVVSRGSERDPAREMVVARGNDEIHNQIMESVAGSSGSKRKCKVEILGVSSQESRPGSILVLVTGLLNYTNSQRTQHFTQAFTLDRDPANADRYFVLNDIQDFCRRLSATYPPIHIRTRWVSWMGLGGHKLGWLIWILLFFI